MLAHNEHARFLADLIARHCQGWTHVELGLRPAGAARGASGLKLLTHLVGRVLGRFHEISIATADIRASVEFYESLGFTQAPTTDAWSHPYGVLTDGRLFIGLHQRREIHITCADLRASGHCDSSGRA